jgi:ribonucleotide reductase alpha subunit
MSEQNIGEVADNTVDNSQEAVKTYTQTEVDAMMARMKGSLEKKLLKPYQDLGDPDELRQLREEANKRQQEQQIKRGEFEKTLQELAAKKDQEISKRDQIIREYKLNTPLLAAAAKFKAVNAEQVKSLVSPYVGLTADNEVEVRDAQGHVRYKDNGEAMGVEDLIQEFLTTNPHFVTAGASTTHTKSSVRNTQPSTLDVSKLDMNNPEHRALYREHRKSLGLN